MIANAIYYFEGHRTKSNLERPTSALLDHVDMHVGLENLQKADEESVQLPKDAIFSNSLRDRRENFSMFLYFVLFSGIALYLVSKKRFSKRNEKKHKKKSNVCNICKTFIACDVCNKK